MPLYYIKQQTDRKAQRCIDISNISFSHDAEYVSRKTKIIAHNIYLYLKENKDTDLAKLKKCLGEEHFNSAIQYLLKNNNIVIDEEFHNGLKSVTINVK